jgi:hypothetical protein
MQRVAREDALEMAAGNNQDSVEALSTDGADEALGERVRLRRAHWRLDDRDTLAGEVCPLDTTTSQY